MQVNISARHGHLDEESKSQITTKMERLLRLFDRLLSIDVTVDLERREMPSVDVRVSAEHKHDFVATDRATSLMAALDGVIHKYKEKVQSRHRTPRSPSASLEAEGSGE